MKDWKSLVRDELKEHREEVLSNCRSELYEFPALTKDDVEKDYFKKLHNLKMET